MPDTDNQASVAIPAAAEDNLTTSEQGSAALETPTGTPDWTEMGLEDLIKLHPQLKDADPERLIQLHPGLKSQVARYAKSQADKAVYRAIQQKEQEATERRAHEEASRREQDFEKLLDEGDPYEVVNRLKLEKQRRKEVEPIIDHVRRSALEDGYKQGQLAELRNLGATFEEVFPFWKSMSQESKREYMQDLGEPRQLVLKLVKDGITKALEDQKKQDKAKAEKEKEIESRSAEPNPDLGKGTPAGGNNLTQAEFDRNRQDVAWRKANLKRMQEAISNGTIKR